jgi:monothiol glutaredoxin
VYWRDDTRVFTCFLSAREWPTVPQVYIGGEFVGGCDIVLGSAFSTFMIDAPALGSNHRFIPVHQSGELETLLEKHNVIPKDEGSMEQPPSPSSP